MELLTCKRARSLTQTLDLQFDALPTIESGYAALWGVKLYENQEIISISTTGSDMIDLRFSPMSIGAGSVSASSVTTTTTDFDGILSAADDTVQKALDTLDNLVAGVLPGWYDVTSVTYGAEGDGVTDDTTAVQDAMDDAHTAGGGIGMVPTGHLS